MPPLCIAVGAYSSQEDEMVVKGKTKSGFEYEVESEVIHSWRFTKCLQQIQGKKSSDDDKFIATMDIISMALGEDQTDALETHLETVLPEDQKTGGVPTSAVLNEFKEIFQKVSEKAKN